jgi:hypothetical protein
LLGKNRERVEMAWSWQVEVILTMKNRKGIKGIEI